MMAVVTLHPQEIVLQPTTFEVIGKFLLHMQGQVLALSDRRIPEHRVVPLDDLIEQHLFRAMTFIRWAV